MSVSVDFSNIRPVEDSRRKGFEELCSQIAHQFEEVSDSWNYTRLGDPDAGIECKWESPRGEVWGWQAKYVDSIDSSSLSQIDDSIEKALDTYNDLSRYFVCVPCDRPHSPDDDGRTKTALQKWNDRKEKWERWADERDMDVEFVFWGQSQLYEFLSDEKHKGRLYFWFDSEQLTEPKLSEELEVTISNANDRYSPELHVDTGSADIFEPLGRTPCFVEDVEERLEELNNKAGDLFTESSIERLKEADEEAFLDLRDAIEKIPVLLEDIEEIQKEIPISELQDVSETAHDAIWDLDSALQKLQEEGEEGDENASDDYTSYSFRQLRSEVYNFNNFVETSDLEVAETAGLKLLGDAGMGKTHLLCNVAKRRMKNGHPTVLMLGENFTNRSIWSQIIERLGLDCTTEEFLGALDSFGESRGVRSLLMIDALNESPDPRIWNSRLPGLLKKLDSYPHIGLCVSCRSGYEDLVIPSSIGDGLVESRHYGFHEVEYEAVRKFFDEHSIEHSSIPVLQREFRVPLFLKLFCENLENQGKSRVSHGPEGLSEIFEGYIDGINERLRWRLDYDPRANLVKRSVEALAREMAERGKGTKRLPKEVAKEIVDDIFSGTSYSESLYGNILSEGLISEVVNPIGGDVSEAVRFSYDKFADHMLAQQYLKIYVDGDFEQALAEEEELQKIFESPKQYPGLIQAFAIHLPEQEGVEVFEFIDSEEVLKPFIKSLGWRHPQSLTGSDGELKEDIEEYLWEEMHLLEDLYELWRVLLTLATSPDHPMNAEYLYQVHMGQKVAQRDFNWSTFLHKEWSDDTSEVFRLVNWGFSLENNPIESRESKRLISLTLSLFLSCPNRFVRDRATKAMVNVVGSDIDLFIELIERFQGVSDPYILERVYTAAYGAVLRNKDHDAVAEIANTVFEIEFSENDPIPHLLARDYARGIIELADYRIGDFEVDIEKVRPPYDSSFSIEVPSPEELQEKVQTCLEESETDVNARFWWGLVGSDFEGRGSSDFARYIVGSNHSAGKVHGFDFPCDKALRWITKRVFDLGWTPDNFGQFDDRVNRGFHGRMGNRKPEKFSKKYQWIAYHELVAWVTDNYGLSDSRRGTPYTGPWTYFRRDIDPSVLDPVSEPERSLDNVVDFDCLVDEVPLDEWVSNHEDFPELTDLLEVSVDGGEWLPLDSTYKWRADESPESSITRETVVWIESVLVHEDDEETLRDWIRRDWIESGEIESNLVSLGQVTQILRGEYPWHPVVEDRWEESGDAIRGAPIDTENTTLDLIWEAEYDCSIQEKYGMFAPTPYLCELLDLEWIIDTREFTQDTEAPIRVTDLSESGGLMGRVDSLSMLAAENGIRGELENEGLSLVWIVKGEKRVLTGDPAGNQLGKSQIRAAYSLNADGEFVGEATSDFHSWD
ncbi:NACHT domain-containing protein [Haloferax massiliensis]|nr:HNH endonuclease [Haloferax massiliensis]